MSDIDFAQYGLMGNLPNSYYAPFGLFTWITPPDNVKGYTLTVEIEFVDGVRKVASIKLNDN